MKQQENIASSVYRPSIYIYLPTYY